MSNLMNLQNQSESNIQTFDKKQAIAVAVAVAFERTGTNPFPIENMLNDIVNEFQDLDAGEIIKAIRNGGLGKYGRTYKLTTQEICVWIRQYINDRNSAKFNPFR
jgi:hypothetical protein